MFKLIYASKERPEYVLQLNLEQILVGSRRRNAEAGVTGILVHHGGMFLQVLEGAEAAVRKIMARIEKDMRHYDIKILATVTKLGEQREFGDWSMEFSDMTGSARVLKGFIEARHARSLANLDEAQATKILEAVQTDRNASA
jgi:hypothetical protein